MKNDYTIKDTVKKKTSSEDYNNYPLSYIIWLIIGILLFIPTLLIAHTHQLRGFQLTIFRDFNNLPNRFKTPALLLTEGLGAGYPIALCVIVALALKRFKLAWRYFVSAGAAGAVMEVAKKVAKEPRPFVTLHGHLHVRAVETGLTSFPSGHEAISTTLALTTWLILPRRWRWVSLIWIVVVAVSRLYLGDHTPADIVGGFAIGLIVVAFIRLLPERIAVKLHLESQRSLLLAKGF
jgi:membrane-associated phospholipid phosphatase